MERRDYLLNQIQQLARFLQLLIEKLLGKSSSVNIEQEMIQKQEEFKENCGFNIILLATPNFDELKSVLFDSKLYNSENIELLADYMALLAESAIDSPVTFINRVRYNALKLYELIEFSGKTYSMERQVKINKLKKALYD